MTHRSTNAGPPQSARGFTIVELMVALALVAILAVLSAPSFATWIASAQVRSTTEAIATGLRAAHGEALKRNASIDFLLTSDDVTNAAASARADGLGWQVRSIDAPVQVVQGRSALELTDGTAVSATAGTLRFGGLGRTLPVGTAYRVDISSPVSGSRPLRVVVAPGGMIRTCDPAVATTDPRGC